MKNFIISLKETNKNDSVFTFYRPESKGYTCSLLAAGEYEDLETEFVDGINTIKAQKDFIINMSETDYSINDLGVVLPNTKSVRDSLGITKNQLLRKHKSI